jgi:hypothetical protein
MSGYTVSLSPEAETSIDEMVEGRGEVVHKKTGSEILYMNGAVEIIRKMVGLKKKIGGGGRGTVSRGGGGNRKGKEKG